MANLGVSTITYSMVDERGYKTDHRVYLPPATVAPVDNSQSAALAYTDVLRPAFVTAELTRLVVSVPYAITDPTHNTADEGMEVSQRCRFRLYPGYRKTGFYLDIPAFKAALLQRSPASGRATWAHLEGATLDLVNAWTAGLGGIAPCNPYEQAFIAVDIGILQTKGGNT